jgi:quercetin dioxygenase-like cupin family protein
MLKFSNSPIPCIVIEEAQMTHHSLARLLLPVASVSLLVLAGYAQQQPAQAPPAGRGNFANNFTGNISVLDAAALRTSRIHFDAGARTNWHVHAEAQIVLAEKGRGRYQEKGGAIADFGEGQPVYLKKGVEHWHGATPDQSIDQMSVYAGELKWLAKVTDEEYLGKKQ